MIENDIFVKIRQLVFLWNSILEVGSIKYLIDTSSHVIVALQSKTQNDLFLFVKCNSTRAFFGESIRLIFRIHISASEIAKLSVKEGTVDADNLVESINIYLVFKVNLVAIHKAASFGGVRMKVDVSMESSSFIKLENKRPNGKNGRMLLIAWIQVIPVQIKPLRICPIMPSIHSVWVYHRNYIKNEIVA